MLAIGYRRRCLIRLLLPLSFVLILGLGILNITTISLMSILHLKLIWEEHGLNKDASLPVRINIVDPLLYELIFLQNLGSILFELP
jgi:hypothetical protein